MSSDVAEALSEILREATEDEDGTVRAAMRRAGYLWGCGHCGFDTVKPNEDDVNCEGCGLSSGRPSEPRWQVRLTQEDKTFGANHYGYGNDIARALSEARKAAGLERGFFPLDSPRLLEETGLDKRHPLVSLYLREIVYHGPENGRARIGYVLRGEQGVFAYAARHHDDEQGYFLDRRDTAEEAYQAVQEEFDSLGPFKARG